MRRTQLEIISHQRRGEEVLWIQGFFFLSFSLSLAPSLLLSPSLFRCCFNAFDLNAAQQSREHSLLALAHQAENNVGRKLLNYLPANTF